MRNYVCGFLFDDYTYNVVLILKSKPAAIAGMWNGIGGKVEDNETFHQAMVREAKEEANIPETIFWNDFISVKWDGFGTVHFFYAFANFSQLEIKTMEAEPIQIFPSSDLPDNSVENLKWLIPMALWDATAKTKSCKWITWFRKEDDGLHGLERIL